MSIKEQIKILNQGVEIWNRWRAENPDESIDLVDADLRYKDLSKADH